MAGEKNKSYTKSLDTRLSRFNDALKTQDDATSRFGTGDSLVKKIEQQVLELAKEIPSGKPR